MPTYKKKNVGAPGSVSGAGVVSSSPMSSVEIT